MSVFQFVVLHRGFSLANIGKRLANQFRRENTDVVGDKPVKNDSGEMSMSKDSKQKAWLEH